MNNISKKIIFLFVAAIYTECSLGQSLLERMAAYQSQPEIIKNINGVLYQDSGESLKNKKLEAPTLPDDKENIFIAKRWDAFMKHCLGLKVYSSDLTFKGTDFFYAPLEPEAKGVTLTYVINDQPSVIPRKFYSARQHCRYGLSDSNKLRIQKSGCVSACLGQAYETNGTDYWEPL